MTETDLNSISTVDLVSTTVTNDQTIVSRNSPKEYFKNYQREKREGVYKQLERINARIDSLENLLNDKNNVEIEMQGESIDWSFTDIKCFLKQVGDIAEDKYNKNINNLSPKEKQKYFRLDKYRQILESLRW
jgi:hypothetical protein